MSESGRGDKRIEELYDLIENIEIALMTTRRPDGMLVTRPMATQKKEPIADLWFVTSIETHKVDELKHDPHVSLGYLNHGSMEWVSVSGIATITQDRDAIKRLYKPDWKAWFDESEHGADGGPDDPRLALIYVDALTAHYMKTKYSKPRVIFEVMRGMLTGTNPDVGREEHLNEEALR